MLRARALPLKCNAPSQYKDRLCLAKDCGGEDSEIHLYSCEFMTSGNEVTTTNDCFENIFSDNVTKQRAVMTRFFERYKRNQLLSSSQKDGPEAPQGLNPSGSRETKNTKNKHA